MKECGRRQWKTANLAAFLHIIDTSRLLEVLREDNRAIFRAASQASKAAEWLLTRHAEYKAGKNAGENATGEGRAAA